MGRVGGPLLDRISLVVDVNRSAAADVLATGAGTSSAQLLDGVLKAREYARWRRSQKVSARATSLAAGDSSLPQVGHDALLLESCHLGERERSFLEMLSDRFLLSGRGIMSTLAVARTIADLDEKPKVVQEHLMEAIGYRPREEVGA
jgi:magnesium chelatase family protein